MEAEKAFGLALKAKRLEFGFTQEALAEKSGLSTRYISRLECNTQQPNYKYIKAIAKALGISSSMLIQAVEMVENELIENKDSCQ